MNSGERSKGGDNLPRAGDAYLLQRFDAVEHEQAEAKKREEHYRKQQLVFDGKLVRYTFWLFIVGMLGTGISVWQSQIAQQAANAAGTAATAAEAAARAAENQLPLQLGQMDIARDQMRAANEAAVGALSAQRDAMRLERHAWLGVQASEALIAERQPGRITVRIRNSGQTPALKVESHFWPVVRAKGQPIEYRVPVIRAELREGNKNRSPQAMSERSLKTENV
jgi:hypothetical protein